MSQYTRKTDGSQDATSLAAGGAHMRTVLAGLVIDKTETLGGVAQLIGIERSDARDTAEWQILSGEAEVYGTGELEAVPAEGSFAHAVKSITAKEHKAWVTLTKKYLRDADADGRRQDAIALKVAEGFNRFIDRNFVGANKGVALVSPYYDDNLLGDISNTVTMSALSGAAFQNAVSKAIDECETEGASQETLAVLIARPMKHLFRDEVDATGSNRKLFRTADEATFSMPFSYSENLAGLAIATTETVAVVGPFSELAKIGVVQDVEMEIFTTGTSPAGVNLATQRAVGIQWVMDAGAGLILPDKFRRIVLA